MFRSSMHSAAIATAVAALALGLFAASAVGWYDKPEKPNKHPTTPTETTPTTTTPTPTAPPVTPPPVVEEVAPPALVTVAPAAAPAPAVAVAPAPAAASQPEVKGEAGTRDESSGGNDKPTVVAQVDETPPTEEAGSSGELAQTGLNMSLLALLGGLALAGSAALFRHSRLD